MTLYAILNIVKLEVMIFLLTDCVQLHLYDVEEQSRSTILNYCSYVQVRLSMILFSDIITSTP